MKSPERNKLNTTPRLVVMPSKNWIKKYFRKDYKRVSARAVTLFLLQTNRHPFYRVKYRRAEDAQNGLKFGLELPDAQTFEQLRRDNGLSLNQLAEILALHIDYIKAFEQPDGKYKISESTWAILLLIYQKHPAADLYEKRADEDTGKRDQVNLLGSKSTDSSGDEPKKEIPAEINAALMRKPKPKSAEKKITLEDLENEYLQNG